MPTNDLSKAALIIFGKRFVLITALLYAALVLGIWTAHAGSPSSIGPVDAYVLTASAIGAVTFGALYAAAMELRTKPQKEPARAESH